MELGLKMLSTMDNWRKVRANPIKKTYGGGVATSKLHKETLAYLASQRKPAENFLTWE